MIPRPSAQRTVAVVAVGTLLVAACGESELSSTTSATTDPASSMSSSVTITPTTLSVTTTDGATTTEPADEAPSTTEPTGDSDEAIEPVDTTGPATTVPTTTGPTTTVPTTTSDRNDAPAGSFDAAIIGVDELEAAGLGSGWEQSIDRFDDDTSSEPAPCGFDALEVPGAVYVDNESDRGADRVDESGDEVFDAPREFEQLISPDAGPSGVAAFRNIVDCAEFADQFTGETSVADLTILDSTNGVAVETTVDGRYLYWYFADIGGTLLGVFYVGPEPDLGPVLTELLTAASRRL